MIKSSKKFKVFLGTLFLAVLALFTVAYAADDDGKITLAKTVKRYDDYGRKSRVALNVSANSYTKSLKLDVVLVLDGSGSMAYGPNGEKDKVNVNNPSRLTSAKKAAKTFISTLITDDDIVKIGLVEYGESIKNTQALTENEKILNNFIDNKYSASGGTNLQAGIEKAHELLDNGSREDSKKLVVILTDGIPTLFNYEGKVYGDGNTDDSICLRRGFFGCNLQKKPSEAAKEELDSLKNNYKKSDVYTITLGNEKEAANILSKVNPEQENPLYKNYKALTGDELQERFNEILNNEIKTIGSSSVVTDTIPAKFKLTKESESNLAKKGVEIVENEDGTTTLKWNIGTIETSKNYSLSYDVEALDDYHGSMYTNTSAILKTTVKEDNPYYAGKTNQELEFNKPTTQVPIITHDDNYSGYEDEVVKGSIFDNDLNKIKELDKEKQTDKLEVRDTLIVKEDANTVKNNDGTYTLYKDGVAQGTLTIDEDGKFTFTPNEGIVGDVSFKYSITTDVITNGKKDSVYSNESTVVINIKPIERVEVDGSKIWVDNNNQDGIRPDKITVKLLANGNLVGSKTVNSKDNWTYKFTNLPKYTKYHENEEQYLIKYTIDEIEVAGYTSKVEGYNIVNTHEVDKTKVSGTKTWVDNNNQDGIRPDKIRVNLLKNNKVIDTKEVTANDNWSYEFSNLDKNENGSEIKYSVVEDTITGYKTKIEGYNITNTHTPELYGSDGKYTVTKIWNDNNNQDGIRDSYEVTLTGVIEAQDEPVYENTVTLTKDKTSYTWTNLAKYNNGKEIKYTVDETKVPTGYTKLVDGTKITNTHETLKTEVVGTKTWVDNNNQDGVRPKEIIVKLLANGVDTGKTVKVTADSNWQYSFTNLDTNSDGKEIKYTVEEQKVPNYTTKVDGYNIINTHEVEKTEVAGTKTWVDNNNQDGKRPDKITIRLLANNVDTGLTATASADTDWKYSFANLDKKANGKDIVYTVTEDEVESYQGVIDGYNITNTHTPETITFSFEKIWVDANNQDGIRPDKIKVNLLADGKVVDTKEITGETKQNWQSNFTDLPKYNNGREIEYSVKEETVPSGYEVSYKDNNTIINTHSPSKRMIEGTKTWNDNDNNDGIRPDKIIVKLFADNIDTGKTFEVSSKTNWQYKFEDLPEYRDGNKIIYTVNEEDVLGYSSEIKGFDIVNTHEVEKISISGTKIWDDHNNNDGIRPDKITVKLLANGIDTGKTAIASVDTNWQYSFKDLNKYKNGEEITYSLEEVSIDGYISEVNQEDYNITNNHSPETITYTVNKKWVDANNNDGIRPESINVSILANGVVIDKTSLSKENNWTYTFGPYNKYENGNLIQYTIVEDAVEGYIQTIEEGVIDNNNNITSVITNTHEVEKETITINKIWNDNNNEQQTRPEFINVKLLANGEVIREFTITKDMNWSYILDNLNKYYNGKLINYSILEDKVDNYQTSYNGFDIINTLTKKYEKAEIIPPQTGDNSSDSESILFMILGLLSLTLALKRVN